MDLETAICICQRKLMIACLCSAEELQTYVQIGDTGTTWNNCHWRSTIDSSVQMHFIRPRAETSLLRLLKMIVKVDEGSISIARQALRGNGDSTCSSLSSFRFYPFRSI